MRIGLYFFICTLFLACDPNGVTPATPLLIKDENGVIVRKTPIWEKKLSDETDYIYTKTDFMYYDNTVVYGGTKDNRGRLVGLDIDNGDILWEYDNPLLSTSSGINVTNSYLYNSYAYLQDTPSNHYFLNIATGDVNFIQTASYFRVGQIGKEELIYVRMRKEDSEGNYYECIVENDLTNPREFREVFCPNYDFNHVTATNYFGYVMGQDIFISEGDTLMLVAYQQASDDIYVLNSFWGTYNLTTDSWQTEKVSIFESPNKPIFASYENNGLFYFRGSGNGDKQINCIEPKTEEVVWSKPIGGGLTFVDEYNLLIVSSVADNKIYALNAQTGIEEWNVSFSANSKMHYQDDILYFIGAGTGYLHALNITNGNEVWRLASPDIENDSQATWSWQINGIPAQNGEKGKIFASSYLTGYCFEAVN